MSLPSSGITQDLIREMMPPYNLSNDLLQAMFAALPPPPRDATAAWRQARITRLLHEVTAFMPADAAQARLATEILIARGLADALTARAHEPGVTVEQMCRLSRSSAELVRTAALVERTLARHQQKPVAFFGTVMADEVDVAALDAVWCSYAIQHEDVPKVTPASVEAAPACGARPEMADGQPDAAPPVADAPPSSACVAPGIPAGAGSPVRDAGVGAAPGSEV